MSKDNKNFFDKKERWSEIKDKLLGSYLTPYFQKVLMTGKPLFYVDCFAGKGKFKDGNDGSPIIALKARESCLNSTKKQNARIDTCFIDLNHAEELSANIATFNSDGQMQVISGQYEQKIEELLSNKFGYNVFLYIDPYGIKALDSSLFDKFKKYGFASFEMLINFNSFGFFRDACRVMSVNYSNDEALQNLSDLVEYDPTDVDTTQQSVVLLNSIAGGDYWQSIVLDYNANKINGYQAEKRLSAEYKQYLQTKYSFVLDMPIRLKAEQRPKYRMIHVCNHEDGCYLMAQNMQKRKDELFTNVQQSVVDKSLVNVERVIRRSIEDFLEPDASSSVENEPVYKDEIANILLLHLLELPQPIRLKKLLVTFVNKYGVLCDFKMIYDILDEMQNKKLVKITRTPASTKDGKPTTFWEEDKDHTITIMRLAS